MNRTLRVAVCSLLCETTYMFRQLRHILNVAAINKRRWAYGVVPIKDDYLLLLLVQHHCLSPFRNQPVDNELPVAVLCARYADGRLFDRLDLYSFAPLALTVNFGACRLVVAWPTYVSLAFRRQICVSHVLHRRKSTTQIIGFLRAGRAPV